MSTTLWWKSYKNHFIYASIYVAGLAILLPVWLIGYEQPSFFDLPILAGMIAAALLLWLELRYVNLRRSMPSGSPGIPLLGDVIGNFSDPVDFYRQKLDAFGSYFTFNYLQIPTLVVSKEEDVKWVLAQDRRGRTESFLPFHIKELLGVKSMLVANGDYHYRLRKLLDPAFLRGATKTYVSDMDQVIQEELKSWADRSGSGEEWLTVEDCRKMAMRVLFRLVLPNIKDPALMDTLLKVSNEMLDGMTGIIPLKIPGLKLYKGHQARKRLLGMMDDIVTDFMAQFPPDSVQGQTTLLGRLCYSKDAKTGECLTREELLHNLLIVVIGGFDTFGGTMSTMLYRLATEPKSLQLALQQEVSALPTELDYDTLKNAPLLNAFIAEIWRLDPPANAHMTVAKEPLQFKNYTIPKGGGISFAIQDAVFSKRYQNPEQFRVERFLPPNHPMADPTFHVEGYDVNTPSSKNRTFGGGPHMCIGHDFARVEARIFVTRLLQSYDFEIRNPKLEKFPLRRWTPEFQLKKMV